MAHDPDSELGLALDVVTLDTPTDLLQGKGSIFDFFGGMRITGSALFRVDADGVTFDEMVRRGRKNITGDVTDPTDTNPATPPATPNALSLRINNDKGVLYAQDFDSLLYLTSWHYFEVAFDYYQNQLHDDSTGSTDHGLIGFYGEVAALDELPIPVLTNDNAAYVSAGDCWALLRVGLQEGAPFAGNQGVIAHEFQHRIFFHHVFADNPIAFDAWRNFIAITDVTDADAQTAINRQNNVLRGIDEGLADIFAIGLVEDVGFIGQSTGGIYSEVDVQRDLNAAFATNATYDNLDGTDPNVRLPDALLNLCGTGEQGKPFISSRNMNPYCLGTVVARSLWDASQQNPQILREQTLPVVLDALTEMSNRLATHWQNEQKFVFAIPEFLDVVAQKAQESGNTPLAADICSNWQARFTSLMPEVASCR